MAESDAVASPSSDFPFPFPMEMQKNILRRMARDRSFLMAVVENMKGNYFGTAYMQILGSCILTYFATYSNFPAPEHLANMVGLYLARDTRLDVNEFQTLLQEVYTGSMPESDQYLVDETVKFIRFKEVIKAHEEARQLVYVDKDFEKAKSVLDRAYSVGEGSKMLLVDHRQTLTERMTNLSRPRNCVPCIVIPKFDEATEGGPGGGELFVVIAPTGKGKTLFLVNFARGGLIKGKNILYVTLETSAAVIAQRLDSSITNRSRAQLRSDPATGIANVESFYTRFGGCLKIAEFQANKASVLSLEHLIHDLIVRHKFVPHKLIVDYADLLKPARFQDQRRFELTEIYVDLRALGKTFDIPVDTASQSNRAGFNVDSVGLEHIAEDIGKAQVADIIGTLSQTEEEFQATPKQARLGIAKNRNNPAGFSIPIIMDPVTMTISPNHNPITLPDSRKKKVREANPNKVELPT